MIVDFFIKYSSHIIFFVFRGKVYMLFFRS